MSIVSPTSLPFKEQNEFFKRKLNLTTEAWTDVYEQEHDYSFMVAGANRDDVLLAFREAIEKTIAEGKTLFEFRADFDRIVKEHGWSYKGGRSWRSRIIYDTNLQQSYNAGRYAQLMALRETRPYWEYEHSEHVANPRPEHQKWHKLVLRWDDPWWDTHFPMNGWGCQCRVNSLSERNLKAMGKAGPDTAPDMEWEEKLIGQRSPGGPIRVRVPRGVDPGFAYTPGKSRLENSMLPNNKLPLTPAPDATQQKPLPKAKPSAEKLLPKKISTQTAADEFLATFGAANTPTVFKDVIGERHALGNEMFYGEGAASALTKLGSHIKLIAEAFRAPAEIWSFIEWNAVLKKAVVKRRYISLFTLADEESILAAVYEYDKNGWGMGTVTADEVNILRTGTLLYERD